ncbi:hypothetical protein BAZOLSSOX_1340 [uncultured Gammaproteobacteria bacterium]|nr:hypothetical protein BAZOLSSOX_1340 [uncultured Gammaproteobacteria bacterium]
MILNSPPHRWLRNCGSCIGCRVDYSPPHRWLRKLSKTSFTLSPHSPPHRWLRNNHGNMLSDNR